MFVIKIIQKWLYVDNWHDFVFRFQTSKKKDYNNNYYQ